jgi:hypothetical protein
MIADDTLTGPVACRACRAVKARSSAICCSVVTGSYSLFEALEVCKMWLVVGKERNPVSSYFEKLPEANTVKGRDIIIIIIIIGIAHNVQG